MVFHLWTHRNSVLHETQALASLSGLSSLRLAITAEFTLGLSSLHRVYSRYFRYTLATLLQQTSDQLKQWFLVIRAGRESLQDSTIDIFSTNAALRNWIGLPPIQT